MKKFITTIKNIWKVEELRKRILFTLLLILVFRVGSYIVLPGVDPSQLQGNAFGDFLDIFTGGAFSNASIMALGIMPYISASIIMQLMGMAVPSIQKMQQEGESGRRKINNFTRMLTIVICVLQAPTFLTQFVSPSARMDDGSFWVLSSSIILTAGTMFAVWLGEKITDKGIGNGVSLLITVGILAGLPAAFASEVSTQLGQSGLILLIVEVVVFLVVILGTVLLVQGVRKVPLQYASQVAGGSRRFQQASRSYFPIKVIAAGVMPIIFAQAVMMVPQLLVTQYPALSDLARPDSFLYNAVLVTMIILFTYFYTAIMINPKQVASSLVQQGGFIPGVKPGTDTANFIDSLVSRLTLPGSVFLALVAILPAFAMKAGVTTGFAYFFGGTSMLIMVGVVLDTLQQIESYLLNRHYDGLMEGGRLRGRGAQAASTSTI